MDAQQIAGHLTVLDVSGGTGGVGQDCAVRARVIEAEGHVG